MSRVAMSLRGFVRRFGRDRSGVALLELALTLPVFLLMMLTGAELTNYITTKMRISQIALQLADNAARMGHGTLLSSKTIREADINDLFVGAGLQSGDLSLLTRGRVILTDLEEDPNHSGKYKIMWQRCKGSVTHASSYGVAGDDNLTGIGPTGRQATAPDDGATMFVEVYYQYQPLIKSSLAPSTTMTEIASMMVRDRRDLTAIYNPEGVTASTC